MRRAGAGLDGFLRANWSLHERIAEITPNHLARATYIGMTQCIRELSVRAESATTPPDYLARRLAVHEQLVAAIRLGDEDRARAAVAVHRGEGGPGVADPC
jgi:GntR family transcriptional repressor for pyruvate dehydrogenase complex